MKQWRKLSVFICTCLILNCLPMRAQAQGSPVSGNKATGEVVDAYISVASMAFPEAAPFLMVGKKLLDLLDVFGKPDATGEALKQINQRLDQIEKRITDVDNKLQALQNDFFKEKNYTRLQLLRTKREILQGLVVQLQEKPAQSDVKRSLVKGIQNLADDFLDPELWTWSDMRRSDGQMLDPDFKPLPTLELYATTLITWMAAISYAGGDNVDYVKQVYAPALQKHIAYLNQTLPENIRARVRARIDGMDTYPKNRLCNYEVYVNDDIRHLVKDAGPGQVQMPSNNVMCSVPEALGNVGLEGEMQRAYGIDVMEAVAAKLDRLRTQGTLAEAYAGTFDPTKYESEAYLYGVKPDGELVWYWHVVVSKPKPQGGGPRKLDSSSRASGPGTSSGPPRASKDRVVPNTQGTGTGKNPNMSRTGTLNNAPEVDVTHLLQGPKLIGSGWDQFKNVLPAGKTSFYGLTQGGTLKWYRNDTSWTTVGSEPGTPQWKGPVTVRSGWGSYTRIVPAGDGILYAITSDGTLKWFRHSGYLDGTVNWSGPIDAWPRQPTPGKLGKLRFSPNWANFKQVFSGGEGVMYTITNDGVLQWYLHTGYQTGDPVWEGPKDVGTGWQDFTRVFSPGDGVIYAMRATGEVLWYKHVGYKDGTVSWQGPVQIAADWQDFIFVFPQMWGTWTPPVIH